MKNGELQGGARAAGRLRRVEPEIAVVTERIEPERLAALVRAWFGDMVKFVVDVESGVAAVGGDLHVDAEQILLARGSRQADLWGANYHPGLGDEAIEYTSLINIRPAQGNRSMEILDLDLRARIRALTARLIGCGEPLP